MPRDAGRDGSPDVPGAGSRGEPRSAEERRSPARTGSRDAPVSAESAAQPGEDAAQTQDATTTRDAAQTAIDNRRRIEDGTPVSEIIELKPPGDVAREALNRARAAAKAKGLYPGKQRRRILAEQPRSGPGKDGRDPKLFAETLAALLQQRGWVQEVSVGGVIGRWREVVGDDIADTASRRPSRTTLSWCVPRRRRGPRRSVSSSPSSWRSWSARWVRTWSRRSPCWVLRARVSGVVSGLSRVVERATPTGDRSCGEPSGRPRKMLAAHSARCLGSPCGNLAGIPVFSVVSGRLT